MFDLFGLRRLNIENDRLSAENAALRHTVKLLDTEIYSLSRFMTRDGGIAEVSKVLEALINRLGLSVDIKPGKVEIKEATCTE